MYIHDIKVCCLIYSAVICTTKFKSLTTGHFLSFRSRVAVQQISCTSSYSTCIISIISSHTVAVKVYTIKIYNKIYNKKYEFIKGTE